jgi:hypothetical protein
MLSTKSPLCGDAAMTIQLATKLKLRLSLIQLTKCLVTQLEASSSLSKVTGSHQAISPPLLMGSLVLFNRMTLTNLLVLQAPNQILRTNLSMLDSMESEEGI